MARNGWKILFQNGIIFMLMFGWLECWNELNTTDESFEMVHVNCNNTAFGQIDKRILVNDDVRCHCIGHLYCHCILETCLLNQSLDNRINECNQLCNYRFLFCNKTINNVSFESCLNYPIDTNFLFYAGIIICSLFLLALISLFCIVAKDIWRESSFFRKYKSIRYFRLTNKSPVIFNNDKLKRNALLMPKSLPSPLPT